MTPRTLADGWLRLTSCHWRRHYVTATEDDTAMATVRMAPGLAGSTWEWRVLMGTATMAEGACAGTAAQARRTAHRFAIDAGLVPDG